MVLTASLVIGGTGAVLIWAVEDNVKSIDLDAVGAILLILAVVALVGGFFTRDSHVREARRNRYLG